MSAPFQGAAQGAGKRPCTWRSETRSRTRAFRPFFGAHWLPFLFRRTRTPSFSDVGPKRTQTAQGSKQSPWPASPTRSDHDRQLGGTDSPAVDLERGVRLLAVTGRGTARQAPMSLAPAQPTRPDLGLGVAPLQHLREGCVSGTRTGRLCWRAVPRTRPSRLRWR